jgi:phosphatidate phosphatase APP1
VPRIAGAKDAHVQSYGGWATTEGATLLGRAVEGEPPLGEHHHTLTKLGSTAHAFVRGDLEHARVHVTDLRTGFAVDARTDDEGFYDVRVPGPLPAGPRTFRIEIRADRYQAEPFDLELVVHDAATPGVLCVTDLDDTLTFTGVTAGKLAVAWGTATRGAADMKPFPAAVLTLRALHAAGAPIVYLTASPIELAPRIERFLRDAGFPEGPLLLRYYRRDGLADPAQYKRARLDRLLADFPRRQVILLGDNGEQDPELFQALASATRRVAAAYVRATLPGKASDARYRGLLLFSHFREVARDLARHGWIRWWLAQRIYLSGPVNEP